MALAWTSVSSKRLMRFVARGVDVGGGADRRDHLVEVVERDLQPFEDVGPFLRPGEIELGAASDDVAPVVDVVLEHPLQAERLRLAVDEGEHVRAEAGLQCGVLEELLHHRVRRSVALDLHDDPHAVPVALVANVAHIRDLLRADEVGHLLDEGRLVRPGTAAR